MKDQNNTKKLLPETGFLRLKQVLGDPKADPPIPALIPISRSNWYAGIKSGRYPTPVKILGPKISLYRVEDILNLINGINMDFKNNVQ